MSVILLSSVITVVCSQEGLRLHSKYSIIFRNKTRLNEIRIFISEQLFLVDYRKIINFHRFFLVIRTPKEGREALGLGLWFLGRLTIGLLVPPSSKTAKFGNRSATRGNPGKGFVC